ncbi:IS1634 family transposase [soil metagenome]
MLAIAGISTDYVVMYMRTTQRRNKDGSVVRYVQLAHNRREGAKTKAEVLINLGREDRLDMAGLRRLAGSIFRYLGDDPAQERLAVDDGAGVEADDLRVVSAKPLGTVWLLDALWARLGIADALKAAVGGRRFTTDVERVLFALVANRAIDPCSKLAAAEWVSCDVATPGLSEMDEDQAYRAMDVLVDADVEGEVQKAVFFGAADLLSLEVDLLLFDTTSTYWERDEEEGQDGLRRYGKSKDARPDLPQVVIGLAVTKEGIPVRVWVWPGNTNDHTVLPQVKDDLRGWRLGRVVTVVDRGFSSKDNLAYLTRAGGHWIAGEKMRDGQADHDVALSRQGRYKTVRDNLRVKEVRLPGDERRRFIVCHNTAEAERDRIKRTETIARLEVELERITAARARLAKAKPGKRRDKEQATHTKAECALRDHPTLGRYLRQLKDGRLRIDRAQVKAEERLDGKYLLSTSDPDLSAADGALGYKNLLEAERGFRDMKSTLELRPVFHRLAHRIHAHVLLCWLALLLIRVAERSTDQTWRRIAAELGRLNEVTLRLDAGTATHTSELTDAQRGIFRACDIKVPPRITHLEPT